MGSIFDEEIERKNTSCLKWDCCKQRFKRADIFPMWVADMDFKSPAQVIDALIRRAEHGVFGYTVPSESLSKALLGWLERRHQWEIDNSWLVHSPGVVTSVNISILAFTEVGDKILLQTPIYYPFYSSIQENQRELVTNPLQNNNGFYEIDFADLEEKLGNGVKMMVFCSPHNPIGRVWRQNELEEVARLCRQYNVILISDEIHSDLVYKGYKHIPIAPLSEEVLRNSVTLVSPTKTFNLAGLCQSTAIIPNAGLRQGFINTISRTGAGMLNVFGLEAAEVAYSCCEDWLEELMIYLQKNLEITEEYFKKYIPQIKVIRPEATYLAWLDCKQLPLEMEKLKEFFTFRAGVGLNDGITFGKEGLGFQRLNFACPRTLLREGLERIRKAVSELYA
ncbi:MAG TPA: PatB family C-S lyase [Desulfitobacteriaceae bacterium]|nr:PatB family C-S lyase [Desulfitobacteriaceae bacterium]